MFGRSFNYAGTTDASYPVKSAEQFAAECGTPAPAGANRMGCLAPCHCCGIEVWCERWMKPLGVHCPTCGDKVCSK